MNKSYCHRLMLIVCVVGGLFVSGCRTVAPDTRTVEDLRSSTGEVIGTAVDRGRFSCKRIHEVRLRVASGRASVEVRPYTVVMSDLDCVRWIPIADSGTVVIDHIRFLNSAADAQPHGKEKSDFRLEPQEYCRDMTRCRFRFLRVPIGTLRYVAVVRHEGRPKQSDPELVVSCNGC